MFVAMWLPHCFADGWGDDLLLLRMGDVAGLWCSLLSLPLVWYLYRSSRQEQRESRHTAAKQ